MKRFFKVIELLLSEEEQAFLDSVSIVDKPAIERNFIAFSEDKPTRLIFNDEKMVVLGPAMVPNQRIPRTDENGDLYFVYFSPETIRVAADLFLKKNKASKNNVNHVPVYTDKLHVMESWIKESDNDKSVDYGFGDLPVGTWFVSMKVDDLETWNKIKAGELNGFSVEGAFMFGPEQLESVAFARYKTKYKEIRRRYRKAYKNLSEQEKRQMDALIYMLEEIGNDKYDDPSEAVSRSRELGLEGRIHSHTDNGLTYYMPGSTHEEYESALLMMEVDVSTLPDYVDPGATGDIQSEFAKVSFDWDETLSTRRGKDLFEDYKERGDTLFIITARDTVSDEIRQFALSNGIPMSRVIATGSNQRKVAKVRELRIDKHIDNNRDVINLLGSKGEKFVSVSPGESKDDYIGRCMSSLQGEYPNEDQRYAVCITEWESGFSKENFESYTDYPEGASSNAQRALDWKEKNGSDCGTAVGWTRARQLANREPISEETIARMASFERHRQNSETPYSEGCGGIMWDAWGGDAGIRWAQNKLEEIRGEFAAVEDLKVDDAVSWTTGGQNPRGRIREIIREGSKKVPGADFEISGTPEDPGYLIEIYEQDEEGNWRPTGQLVGRKADSLLKNVEL